MNDGAEAVAKEGRLSVSSSGFPGFEFTPAERVTLARRQDYQGPIMMAQHEGQVHGVYEEMLKISRAYLQLRPIMPRRSRILPAWSEIIRKKSDPF